MNERDLLERFLRAADWVLPQAQEGGTVLGEQQYDAEDRLRRIAIASNERIMNAGGNGRRRRV